MAPRKKSVKKHNANQRGTKDSDGIIGNRIRAYRIERGLSQEQLGIALKVSFQQIQKYEKGTNRLSATRLIETAKIMGVTPHDLLGWNGAGVKLGKAIDVESFKLAQEFCGLRDGLKPAFRNLIETVMKEKTTRA